MVRNRLHYLAKPCYRSVCAQVECSQYADKVKSATADQVSKQTQQMYSRITATAETNNKTNMKDTTAKTIDTANMKDTITETIDTANN